MKATVFALAEEFSWTVDYEDPPYSKGSPDVSDITDPTWRTTHPNDRFFGLKGGSFITNLAPSEAASTTTPIATVERIVSEYNQSSLPGRFLVRAGEQGRVAVVGVGTRNSSGGYEPSTVLLDTALQLPPSKISLIDALTMVTDALSKMSGHQVVVGTLPINLLRQVQCVVSSEKMTSRVAIERMLNSAPMKIAYYLLHDPNDDLYVLNLGVVKALPPAGHGEKQKQLMH